MIYQSLKQQIKQFLFPVTKTPNTTSADAYMLTYGDDPRVPIKQPDVLVEISREIAADLLTHPEKYITNVMGAEAMVVDDASYEALFYLFSGQTRKQMWEQEHKVAAIYVHHYIIINRSQLVEARKVEQGWR